MPGTLFITDLGKNSIQVSWQHAQATRLHAEPSVFVSPLTEDDQKQLRWYMEDYLDFPVGAEEWKAEQVERQMVVWGERLFSLVFGDATSSNGAYSLYEHATTSGLDKCELCVESADPTFLGIQWELLRDPSLSRGYLAPLLKGLYRRLPHLSTPAISRKRKEKFRILLIIARPSDVSPLPIEEAQRIFEVARPLRPYLEVDVLRPPTLDALQEELNARPDYYQAVHFDGHGVFDGEKGNLVFEKEDGRSHIVSSDALGQLLANNRIPLFVLSACQTSQESSLPPCSSVASRLVATGVVGVVAMSYSVQTDAASRFMQRLYEALLRGSTLSEGVASGRRKLYSEPDRQSATGTVPFRDWMVPVLYQQRSGYVPIHRSSGVALTEDRHDAGHSTEQARQTSLEGRLGFIGRGEDIVRIERALVDDASPCVVLSGIAGAGKTELAYGFARWYAESGGCPGGVFVTSFRHNASFGQVADSIVEAAESSQTISESVLWHRLVSYLRSNRCLLVWDNAETVDGYPDGNPLATPEDRLRLSDLLTALRGSSSRVIITTRRQQETWIGTAFTLLDVGSLSMEDSSRLANVVLRTIGRTPDDYRNDEDYLSLLRLLDGHPRSLEIVLPHLRTRAPREIIDAIQHRIDAFTETLLDASLQYAFSGLSHESQVRIPLLGVFASRVMPSVVAAFDKDWESRGSPMGQAFAASQWERILNEAADLGLLRTLPGPIYELHPTISPFLRATLSARWGEDWLSAADMLFAECYAALSSGLLVGPETGDEAALARLLVEEDNFIRALQVAEQAQQWRWVLAIAPVIQEYYRCYCRWQDWRSLRRRLLALINGHLTGSTNDIADLGLYLKGDEANDALMQGHLDRAETIYQQLVVDLRSSSDDNRRMLALCYHSLGLVAAKRLQFEEAEGYHQSALNVFEALNAEANIADEYLHMGIIEQHCGDLDRAELLCQKALEIHKRVQSEEHLALDYHQLGRVAELRRQFDKAAVWCRMALEINERLGNWRAAATNCHELGLVAREQKRYDEAEGYYRLALSLFEQLEAPIDVAEEYTHLGTVARGRKLFAEAEVWYQKALDICEQHREVPLAARIYGELGILKCDQGRSAEAVGLMGRAALTALDGSIEHLTAAMHNLASLCRELGEEEFLSLWHTEFGEIEPHLIDGLREIQQVFYEARGQ